MADLVVVAFDKQSTADKALAKLKHLQQWDYIINLEDAVVVVRNDEGKVKLKQGFSPGSGSAVSGGFWGLLFGAALGVPVAGVAAGAAAGGLGGSLSDFGVDDDFVKQIGDALKPGTSAIFALVHWSEPERVREEMHGFGGTVVNTTLSDEAEAKLQAALKGDD